MSGKINLFICQMCFRPYFTYFITFYVVIGRILSHLRMMFELRLFLLAVLTGTNIFAGEIQITCKPGLRVYLDGNFMGISCEEEDGKYLANISPGVYIIRVEKSGFAPHTQRLTVHSNSIHEIKVPELNPTISVRDENDDSGGSLVRLVGELTVTSAPFKCRIVFLGETYDKTSNAKIFGNIPVGEYPISISRSGKTLKAKIKIDNDQMREIKADFLDQMKIIDLTKEQIERDRLETERSRLQEERAQHERERKAREIPCTLVLKTNCSLTKLGRKKIGSKTSVTLNHYLSDRLFSIYKKKSRPTYIFRHSAYLEKGGFFRLKSDNNKSGLWQEISDTNPVALLNDNNIPATIFVGCAIYTGTKNASTTIRKVFTFHPYEVETEGKITVIVQVTKEGSITVSGNVTFTEIPTTEFYNYYDKLK